MIKLLIEDNQGLNLSEDFFDVYLQRAQKKLKDADGIINLIFCDDIYIQNLNEKYRKKEGPTDVLSFPYWDKIEDGMIIGDIYISTDMAKMQAKDRSESLENEIKVLFVHGMLHLFGFDHNNDQEEYEMESYARLILE